MKVEENYKCLYCTHTVDVTEHIVVVFRMSTCAAFWNFIEGIIMRECGINVKLHHVWSAKIKCKSFLFLFLQKLTIILSL